jgi:hypothetical protein
LSIHKAIWRLFTVAGFAVATDSEITIDHRFSVTPIGARDVLTQHIPSTGNVSFLPVWLEMPSNGFGNTRAWPTLVFAFWCNRAALVCRDR